jgi:hypothetical protein
MSAALCRTDSVIYFRNRAGSFFSYRRRNIFLCDTATFWYKQMWNIRFLNTMFCDIGCTALDRIAHPIGVHL